MAAEGAGRLCCGLELDPKYVDVIIGRWQEATGKEARLEGAGTTFHEVKMQRQRTFGAASEIGRSSAGSVPPKKVNKKQAGRRVGKGAIQGVGRKSSRGKVTREGFKKAA
jgi:hypothetical protein